MVPTLTILFQGQHGASLWIHAEHLMDLHQIHFLTGEEDGGESFHEKALPVVWRLYECLSKISQADALTKTMAVLQAQQRNANSAATRDYEHILDIG